MKQNYDSMDKHGDLSNFGSDNYGDDKTWEKYGWDKKSDCGNGKKSDYGYNWDDCETPEENCTEYTPCKEECRDGYECIPDFVGCTSSCQMISNCSSFSPCNDNCQNGYECMPDLNSENCTSSCQKVNITTNCTVYTPCNDTCQDGYECVPDYEQCTSSCKQTQNCTFYSPCPYCQVGYMCVADKQNCSSHCQPVEPAPPIPTIKLVAGSLQSADQTQDGYYYSTMPIYGVVLLTIFCVLIAVGIVLLALFLMSRYRHSV
jgi:hypothetical protein